MIARVWRGWTKTEDADAYVPYVEQTGIEAFRSTPGNAGSWILRRTDQDRTEFVVLSLWESVEAIKAFAGENIDVAVFYPEDDRFLVERENHVTHYEVASSG